MERLDKRQSDEILKTREPVPNQLRVSDFTRVPNWQGMVHVAFDSLRSRCPESGHLPEGAVGAELLPEASIDTSVGSVADSYDIAPAESIIGPFKAGAIKFPGRWKSVGRFGRETLKRVDWHDTTRLRRTICHVTPQEAEETDHASLNDVEKAARSLNRRLSGEPGPRCVGNRDLRPVGDTPVQEPVHCRILGRKHAFLAASASPGVSQADQMHSGPCPGQPTRLRFSDSHWLASRMARSP